VARPFLLAGLTGGIATGKSTVSAMFTHLGCRVTDADQLARDVVTPGQPAHAAIVAEFGVGMLQPDGYVDRKRLGAIIFADAAKRKRLEAITHPAIRTRWDRILRVYEEEAYSGVVFWDAALLYETAGARLMEKMVVVFADPATQLARLIARDGCTEAEARARIASQMPVAEKAKLADYVVDNSGSLPETERQVREVHRALLADLAARRAAPTP
jgi:dephospho-CoA kinase